jgi:hypothetical protein
LDAESARALELVSHEIAGDHKRHAAVPMASPDQTHSLRRIYLLGEGAEIAVESVGHAEVFLELIKGSYYLEQPPSDRLARDFSSFAELAASGIARRLRYPRRMSELDKVVEAVHHDLARA